MSSEELQKLLTDGISLDNATYIILFVVCTLSGWLGAYLSSYAKEKGKNYATKEDFDSLKTQTRDLTIATEKVKSEIANNSWKSSKKWELKFKIYTEILESLSAWRMAIGAMKDELYSNAGDVKQEINKERVEEVTKKSQVVFENLARIEAIAEVVLSNEQSAQIRLIKDTVNQGMKNLIGIDVFLSAIERIKTLEAQLAREAKAELFEQHC
ncbi:hypothetical protein DLR60_16180 [Vibrio tarriae]|uniref:hypothetical protein n=1 Tax=Vibrio TaxID=662 RepID=UPI000DE2C86F|nr:MULTISPECIES: hypothetical protein [Vibrio]MCD1238580.1 hypothetical protein [Vibrio cholerae]RBM66721.1 hypothetical protein DLR60_16180 [Vibrio tarriae]